jgi:hypothetical protein
MEVLAIVAALAAGAHYINKDDAPDNVVHSSQPIGEIVNFGHDDVSLAQIDWSKAGNFRVGDSSENNVQWVFITN